jgi:hypothetical protein
MRQRPASVLGFAGVFAIAFGMGQVSAQSPDAPVAPTVGPEAVQVVLKHFSINQLVSDPNTHKPLRADGSWSLSKSRPLSCAQATQNCVEVFYEVPAQSAKCSWVISLDPSNTDGTILDENDDADNYMVRTLTGSEATPLVKSRSKPVTPPISIALGASGTVVTRVLIGKSGDVQKVSPVSGPPVLVSASIDAVKKWSFSPLKIGTRAVQYEVQVAFTFYPPIQTMAGAVKMTP